MGGRRAACIILRGQCGVPYKIDSNFSSPKHKLEWGSVPSSLSPESQLTSNSVIKKFISIIGAVV